MVVGSEAGACGKSEGTRPTSSILVSMSAGGGLYDGSGGGGEERSIASSARERERGEREEEKSSSNNTRMRLMVQGCAVSSCCVVSFSCGGFQTNGGQEWTAILLLVIRHTHATAAAGPVTDLRGRGGGRRAGRTSWAGLG